MAKMNVAVPSSPVFTHEAGLAVKNSPLQELRRTVLSCLLWEGTFYESGDNVAGRIETLVPRCHPAAVAALAIEARDRMYLRHVPLFLVRQLAKFKGNGTFVAETLAHVIQRPDELGEYLAIYWGGQTTVLPRRPSPISAGSKRGLARAFTKFSAYQLAKYDRDAGVKLRDVLRLVHAKPLGVDQAALWKQVIARTLETPDTWETALSAGQDKKATFERLLREQKLGALAFLRNLRNMVSADVDATLIRERFAGPLDKVLPFRFIAAARHAPAYAAELSEAMLRVTAELPKLPGKTIVLVDVSSSMDSALSDKSEMLRADAANGLAVLVRELGDCRIFSFSDRVVEVSSWHGLPLATAIQQSQPHSGTALGDAVKTASQLPHDRLIVITDEQSSQRVPPPPGKGYMINVASYQHGVGYGPWVHIDGFSERVLDFIREVETAGA